MNESFFGNKAAEGLNSSVRQPIGRTDGRYVFFKVRRHGKLHFEKRVAECYLHDIVTVEALRKEFEIGYGLQHPGIARYLDFDDNALYEEYIDGLTLRQMLDNNDANLIDAVFMRDLCRQLLEAIGYLHKHGILHLDIKPENVIICNIGNTLKLIDFGSARTAEFDTTEGFTPSYMAPEQARGCETDVTTDLFLVGNLMDELTRGSKLRILWAPFIRRATASIPSQRFPSAVEALKAIPQGSPKAGIEPGKNKKTYLNIISFIGLIVVAYLLYAGKETAPELPEPTKKEINTETKSKDKSEAKTDATGDVLDPATVIERAEQGDPVSQETLGFMYTNGTGVMADPKKAFEWFKKAADNGLPKAYADVGVSYREGDGVAKNIEMAKLYFEKGVEAGDEHAAYLLADLYSWELLDLQRGWEWHKRASEMGSRFSTQILVDAYRKGDLIFNIEPDESLAAKYSDRLQEINKHAFGQSGQ